MSAQPCIDADRVAATLSPELARGLRIVSFADHGFEPYVERLVAGPDLAELARMGLIEQGQSIRPAVGPIGYRLSPLGWDVVSRVWYHASPVQDPAAQPAATMIETFEQPILIW